jgi:hypothetical protein
MSTKNVISLALATAIVLGLAAETGFCAKQESKMVTRIETVKATMKGGKLIIEVHGMARIGTGMGLGTTGKLVRRGQNFAPNKDGLLEYELHFNPPGNYKEDKLNPVKADLTESSIPSGVKGVRVYAEYNELNGMLPDATKQEPASKKEPEAQNKKEIPSKKKEPFLNTETAAKKEEAAKTEPKPTPTPAKKHETPKPEPTPAATSTPVKKEKKSWNPFHHKATPSPTPAASPEPKKEEPVLKKETAPKKEPVAKNEATVKTEATPSPTPTPTPKSETAEKKKKKGSWWNPFHKKSESSPVVTPTP